jgi:tRNA(Arg) A34 adenosine deaminase TadA
MTDTYFMQQALAEARKAAEAGEVPVGRRTYHRTRTQPHGTPFGRYGTR